MKKSAPWLNGQGLGQKLKMLYDVRGRLKRANEGGIDFQNIRLFDSGTHVPAIEYLA